MLRASWLESVASSLEWVTKSPSSLALTCVCSSSLPRAPCRSVMSRAILSSLSFFSCACLRASVTSPTPSAMQTARRMRIATLDFMCRRTCLRAGGLARSLPANVLVHAPVPSCNAHRREASVRANRLAGVGPRRPTEPLRPASCFQSSPPYIGSMQLPDEVPVMTLPSATLFPQALLPLYIFEPRYRRMLSDALNTNRMFSVAMQKPGRTRETPCPIAGLGLIRVSVGHNDGTSHLILQGLTRVQLKETVQYKPY